MIDPSVVPMAALCGFLLILVVGFHAWEYFQRKSRRKH